MYYMLYVQCAYADALEKYESTYVLQFLLGVGGVLQNYAVSRYP